MRYLMTFDSTAHAIKAEHVLLENKVSLKIRPLPNEISSGCGISIIFDDLDAINLFVSNDKFKYNKLYEHKENKYIEIN